MSGMFLAPWNLPCRTNKDIRRNVLGARLLSESGRQIFLVDSFRDTGRPLLSVMTDKDSIFYKGLACFRHRVLYTNVVNDRSTPYYTSGISRTDPYADIENLKVNYVSGYEPVVLDPRNPFTYDPKPPAVLTTVDWISYGSKRVPKILLLTVVVPVVIIGFVMNSLFQTFNSRRRIKLHLTKQAEWYEHYRNLPLLLREGMRDAVEDVLEDINSIPQPEHLSPDAHGHKRSTSTDSHGSAVLVPRPGDLMSESGSEFSGSKMAEEDRADVSKDALATVTEEAADDKVVSKKKENEWSPPVLALAEAQVEMIENLDMLGFRKIPVWIHDDGHSHAAMINRRRKKGFQQGTVVVRHWLREVFEA